MEELLDLLNGAGIHSTLFVIPHNLSDNASSRKYVDLLVKAKMSGHEIGLHGYSHAKNEFGFIVPVPLPSMEVQCTLLRKGRECLQNEIGESPVGFRAPDYRHSRVTLQALESLGFKYDSSKSVFKPTGGMRFRFRTGISPKPKRIGTLLEIPVTGDYTNGLDRSCFSHRLARAKADFKWVKKLRGVFVLNCHLQVSGTLGIDFLRRLINELHEDTEFVRLRDLI